MIKPALALVLGLAMGVGSAAAQTVTPDTPAGRALKASLEAFDSLDQAKMAAFIAAWKPPTTADEMLIYARATGGFDLVSIDDARPDRLLYTLKARIGGVVSYGDIVVSGTPPTILAQTVFNLPPGVKPDAPPLDAALRKRVVDGVGADLAEAYIYPAVAQQMTAKLQAQLAAGAYDGIDDGTVLARRLTDDLRGVSHDLHLHVEYRPAKWPPLAKPDAAEIARRTAQMLASNCAFQEVELLPGNIGYIKFNGFADADVCAPTATAAMAFVAHADALILDLRDNTGGDPQMVQFLASYLFDGGPTHLNDLHARKDDATMQYWTLPFVPGTRMPTQPVFVLTSRMTFSGGEEFAYDLQTQKRATLVGETTGGGAHPVDGRVVEDDFLLVVPVAEAINPVTKTSWEGTGVTPDVKTSAADALTTAEGLALKAIAAKGPPSGP